MRALLALRDEIEVAQKTRDEARQRCEALPRRRRRYLLLDHELGLRLLEAHREWLDIVERELRKPDDA